MADSSRDGTSLVRAAIGDWRDSLVNLTGMNRLLNFKPRKTSAVQVFQPDSATILSRLLSGGNFQLRAVPTQADPDGDQVEFEMQPAPHLLDSRMQPKDLQGALRNLLRRGTAEFLDRGLQVLYLAFGELSWTDETDAAYNSPLLLVPVQLITSGPKQPPLLGPGEDDSTVNPALTLRLAQFGITLPAVEQVDDEFDLQALFAQVRVAIADQNGWSIADTVTLSYFSFHKEAMYRDLLDHENVVAEHAIVQALATGGRGANVNDFDFDEIPEEQTDTAAPPETTPLVLDADSSQRACVAAALAGRSFVMDGPPGTGKSQTISNMIGALLEAGKTVLFVSEKAAALQVVRDRLTEAGLENYLLELHSHKATRREVAIALGQGLETVPIAPAPMSPMDLNAATRRRQELNAYAQAMNVERHPLGLSLHNVLGMTAVLHAVPASPATGLPPIDLTVETFARIRTTAHQLSRAWRPALQGGSFVWRGVTERSSMDARLYQATRTLTNLAGLTGANRPLNEAFGLTKPSQATTLADLLEHLEARPAHFPDVWLTVATLDQTQATTSRLAVDLAALKARQDETNAAAGIPWLDLPDPSAVPIVDTAPLAAMTPAGIAFDELTAEAASQLARRFGAEANKLEARVSSLAGLTAMLGLPPANTFADADATLRVAGLAYTDPKPPAAWISPGGLDEARNALTTLHSSLATLAKAQQAAGQYYTDAALRTDAEGLAGRFTTHHHGFGKMTGAYRTDKKAVQAFTRQDVSKSDAHANLPLAVAWQTAIAQLLDAEARFAPLLSPYYNRDQTDWNRASQAVNHAAAAVQGARTTKLSKLAEHITAPNPNSTIRDLISEVSADLDAWRASLAPDPIPAGRPELLAGSVTDAAGWLRAQVGPLHAAANLAGRVSEATGRQIPVGGSRHIMTLRAATDAAHSQLNEHSAEYLDIYQDLYDGANTDIAKIRQALTWTEQIRSLIEGPLTLAQTKALDLTVSSPKLRDTITAWDSAQAQLVSAFDSTRQVELAADLNDYVDGDELLASLKEDTAGQDEWFAYTGAREKLAVHGLELAVEFCIAERIPAETIPQVIERALLQEWADHVLATDPALKPVRAEDRDALIAEYRALDKKLIGSSTSRIITAANSRRPKAGIGESAIIQREAVKKRKHMPVRELINRAKHVIPLIKPCFMMSPLAVSQFLPPDLTFDVVIFDEASQVSPGDAVNCIYRGRALITGGDQKQLPPTNFFASSSIDDSGEWSEDDNDATDFESILDLAKSSGAFKSLTLRWHYRSRHEALIAFSNASFYDGRLITFPGAEDDGPNVGVELFKVDGVYRRGSSRDNPVEAAKVAELVMNHHTTRPRLSLGVVTFSEAQASLIEGVVETALVDRPDLERFFTADRLGGFFVKSLESVQGDERDVMIFSIGYGPDENGKTTMNFGPVNRPGGWRRLNVAVTRARYRNEIVSSITAGEITETTANEGVRHLRRYLDYAARGIPALALDTSGHGDAESPFEESVISVIRSWGYDVTPQVGAARYRIDIGVRHPDHPGVYVLAVECDGFMYHSSKTARDRDRLREQVLRGLGWNVHRIWGTAWYRNRHGEEARLLAAIESATALPIRGLLADAHSPQGNTDIDRPIVETTTAVLPDHPDWAQRYETATVPPLRSWIDVSDPGARFEMSPAIETIARAEGPVHLSVMHQRLRDAWDIGRIGAKIRDNIDAAIRLAEVTRAGDFIDIPQRGIVAVRTPSDVCARSVEQVHESELTAALINYVSDSGGVSQDELTTAVARLYGWNRRGSGIQNACDHLVGRLLATGVLTGDAGALSTRA